MKQFVIELQIFVTELQLTSNKRLNTNKKLCDSM